MWVCYHFTAFSVACSVLSVIASTVYWCVITYYELNCLRVTAFSFTCCVKCAIPATVHSCAIVHGSTVCVLPLSVLQAIMSINMLLYKTVT